MSNEIVEKLKQISIFADVKDKPEALKIFAQGMEIRRYNRGQKIIVEGEDGDEMFILYKGAVEISKNTFDKEMYTVTRLNSDQNAFFGELAMLDNDSRSATVVAIDQCELLVLSKEKFFEIGNTHPTLGLLITRQISQILGMRLRRANKDVITLFEALVTEIEESA